MILTNILLLGEYACLHQRTQLFFLDRSTMRLSKRYRESTREDDDSHSRVSDVVAGTNRLSYQVREPFEKNEERLAMKRDDYTPTSSSVSTSSSC